MCRILISRSLTTINCGFMAAMLLTCNAAWAQPQSPNYVPGKGSVSASSKLPPPPTPNPPPSVAVVDSNEKSGAEILTRGPVHQAYAQPSQLGRSAGTTVKDRPPQPLNELPPEQRPTLDGIVWIPGYWAWDDEKSEFLWISGVWRVPPPDSEWIPGYWAKVEGGQRWVAGFWADSNLQDLVYYPEPPVSLENGPMDAASTANDFWTPGSWVWQDSHYKWKPGYWAEARAGSVWTPPSYRWTPRGYMRTVGFWDATLEHRGLLFAPAATSNFAYQHPGAGFVPSVAIVPATLNFYLFARPATGTYYFGDYFAPENAQRGIFPWYLVNRVQGYNYDPLFSYDRWFYRNRDPGWLRNMQSWQVYYRDNPAARPPRTMTAQSALEGQTNDRADRNLLMIGKSLGSLVNNPDCPMHFSPLTNAERSGIMEDIRAARKLTADRTALEADRSETPKAISANESLRSEPADSRPEKVAWPHRDHTLVGSKSVSNSSASPDRVAKSDARSQVGGDLANAPDDASRTAALPAGQSSQPRNRVADPDNHQAKGTGAVTQPETIQSPQESREPPAPSQRGPAANDPKTISEPTAPRFPPAPALQIQPTGPSSENVPPHSLPAR
jgi:hypothetical protein